MILACATGNLRVAYILVASAGLRAGEVCRLRWEDAQLDAAIPVALIHGKGGTERIVPLLVPVVEELLRRPQPHRGVIITRPDGRPIEPVEQSGSSTHFLRSIGMETTLHSMRHAFATQVVRMTKDVLFVRDLLGHQSLTTTQVYMNSDLDGAHDRLADMSTIATSMLHNRN
jgi:integrase